ncbi:MAG: hypothetical protein KME42_22565 [Tildeniella nuda ZEHNDER 1965/U140]|nr:hypothetical protein [Tildeniella nuda ZEHNDER 1965/U140]
MVSSLSCNTPLSAFYYVTFDYVIVSKWTQTPQALYNGNVSVCACAIAAFDDCKVILAIAGASCSGGCI